MSEQEYIERMKEEIRGKLKHSLDSPTDFDYLAPVSYTHLDVYKRQVTSLGLQKPSYL